MPLIVRINFEEILLPDDAPVATLLKTFAKAVVIDDRSWDRDDPRVIAKKRCQIEIKTLPAETRLVGADDPDAGDLYSPSAARPGTAIVAAARRRRTARPAALPLLDRES